MKADVLKEYIKKVVQQEVRNVLKNELREHLTEVLTGNSVLTPKKSESVAEPVEDFVQESQKPKKFVKYTNNPVLNQILNETTGGVPKEGTMVSLTEGFSGGSSTTVNEIKPPENAPEPVKSVYSAMNKDYSKLMKAIDKRKGSA